MIKTFCDNVVSVFTHCDSVAAIYTYCEQVWPVSSTEGAWYVKWEPELTSGSFKMFNEYYNFSDYTSIFRWSGEGTIYAEAFKTTPMTYMQTNVLGISRSAFYSCSQLRSIKLTQCEYVGIGAFSTCRKLSHISLPECITISSNAFQNCDLFGTITLPKCEYVGSSAFRGNEIKGVSLPECKYVGSYAFCSQPINYVNLPKCSYIGIRAFDYSYSSGGATLRNLYLPECEHIGASAFIAHVYLSQIVLPKCSYIGSDAFRYDGIENLTLGYDGVCFLSNSHITSNISYICVPPSRVLEYRQNSQWAYYADKIVGIGSAGSYKVYWYPYNLSGTFNIAGCDLLFSSFRGSYSWISPLITDGTFMSTGITSVSSPSITFIDVNAFKDCTSLASASFPNVSGIAGSAFQGCTGLSRIYIPVCSAIDHDAFKDCTSLRYIDAPKCSYIYDCAFMNCTSLQNINLPKCYEIGSSAFQGCTALSNIISLSEIRKIHEKAFYGCTSISFLSSLFCSVIGSQAFMNCTSLTSFTFKPNRYTGECIIHSSAFKNCTSLSLVDLHAFPKIEKDVFYNCSNLSTLYINTYSIPELTDIRAFWGTKLYSGEGVIYVLSRIWPSILSANNWSYFSSIIRIKP